MMWMDGIGLNGCRTVEKIEEDSLVPKELILKDLNDFQKRPVDLIIEVSHPKVIKEYGVKFLNSAHLMVGSPTTFSDSELESLIRTTANSGAYGCYIPSGLLFDDEYELIFM